MNYISFNLDMKKIVILLWLLYPLSVTANCINVGVIKNNPAGYINSEGKKTGVHWDYFEAISGLTGICMKKSLLPYARVRSNLSSGVNDLSLGFLSDKTRKYAIPLVLIREIETVVITLIKPLFE